MKRIFTRSHGMAAAGLVCLIPVLSAAAAGLPGSQLPGSDSSSVYLEAESGVVTAPFIITNGYLYQPIQSRVTSGGRAAYRFTITNAGKYAVQARVDARGDADASFFVNIDAEPQEPGMAWHIPMTAGFEHRLVSWQGNGTWNNPQFVPKYFELTQGSHQLIIRGREADVRLARVALLKAPSAPKLRIVSSP